MKFKPCVHTVRIPAPNSFLMVKVPNQVCTGEPILEQEYFLKISYLPRKDLIAQKFTVLLGFSKQLRIAVVKTHFLIGILNFITNPVRI